MPLDASASPPLPPLFLLPHLHRVVVGVSSPVVCLGSVVQVCGCGRVELFLRVIIRSWSWSFKLVDDDCEIFSWLAIWFLVGGTGFPCLLFSVFVGLSPFVFKCDSPYVGLSPLQGTFSPFVGVVYSLCLLILVWVVWEVLVTLWLNMWPRVLHRDWGRRSFHFGSLFFYLAILPFMKGWMCP